MYNPIVSELIETIKIKDQIILVLLRELSKCCLLSVPEKEPVSLEYQKLNIDDIHIYARTTPYEQLDKLDYKLKP